MYSDKFSRFLSITRGDIILIIEAINLKKYFGERLILDIPELRLYTSDRVGLVGANGAGKTTLMNILAGVVQADEGGVRLFGEVAYVSQLDPEAEKGEYGAAMSGGEKTLAKIRKALGARGPFIMADEPTCNLSIFHVEELTEALRRGMAGYMIISHDREFLNSLCNRIIEIDDGKLTEYRGNYDFYRQARQDRDRRDAERYEAWKDERERLTDTARSLKQKAGGMKHAPKRMGNSEARLWKGEVRQRAGYVAKAAKVVEGRLTLLEKEEPERPKFNARTRIDIREGTQLHSKTAIEAVGIGKAFGKRVLFAEASFRVPTGSKTAILGENGSGKTTLIRMIMDGAEGIKTPPALKIAYFAQDLRILDEERTVLENVSEGSAMTQTMIRNILSRMLFFREDAHKPVSALSGGERVKAALAKIFAKDVNTLILDEPSNYLDVYSMESLEGLIRDYEGTILIATHDKSLINTAERLLIVENGGITTFEGSYAEYGAKGRKAEEASETKADALANDVLMLENRLARLAGRLSEAGGADEKETLNREYMELAAKIRTVRNQA